SMQGAAPMSLGPSLDRQLARASRRMFLQTLLNHLIWCCAGALALGALWFFIEPQVMEAPAWWQKWAVAGGLLSVAILTAAAIALWQRPSAVDTALSLDAKFGLKERVTTSLLLEKSQKATPAGQALLADANQRVAELDVNSRFPVRLTWQAALVPAAALGL